jgi:hypothetical protein
VREGGTVLHLEDIRQRIGRLRQLVDGLAREIALWQTSETPLQPLEKRLYVQAVHEVLLNLDRAVVVLEAVVRRIEALGLTDVLDAEKRPAASY